MLPESRAFVLPSWLGWTCNLVSPSLSLIDSNVDQQQIGIAYAILTTVLFMFPPELPVTGNNMNYCIAAFAIVLIVSVIQWFVDGRKNYTGPQIDVDALKSGEVVGMAPTESNVGDRQSAETLTGEKDEKKAP